MAPQRAYRGPQPPHPPAHCLRYPGARHSHTLSLHSILFLLVVANTVANLFPLATSFATCHIICHLPQLHEMQ